MFFLFRQANFITTVSFHGFKFRYILFIDKKVYLVCQTANGCWSQGSWLSFIVIHIFFQKRLQLWWCHGYHCPRDIVIGIFNYFLVDCCALGSNLIHSCCCVHYGSCLPFFIPIRQNHNQCLLNCSSKRTWNPPFPILFYCNIILTILVISCFECSSPRPIFCFWSSSLVYWSWHCFFRENLPLSLLL